MAAVLLELPDEAAAAFAALSEEGKRRVRVRMVSVVADEVGGATAPSGIRDDEEFDRRNQRRIDLLEKRDGAGWSPDEEAEFRRLQRETSEYLNRKYPMPLAEMADLERRLLTALDAAGIPLPADPA